MIQGFNKPTDIDNTKQGLRDIIQALNPLDNLGYFRKDIMQKGGNHHTLQNSFYKLALQILFLQGVRYAY